MTREEREKAIDIFDDNFTVINTHGHYTDEEVEQARQMAIKALSTKTCLDCGYQYLDDDECPRCGSERWE